ncbi:hypothetical protein R3W88_001278 [Solanum pinnatisectum]|uniref:UBC core domain-containing protein n=1 Tax=Solanum pinnatisectum TaxID=50273 RepID=A0AAV9MIK1_9SOLN|nr:hypothetical protein R3W88_001278 [Solanum pinnatisectum]
MRLDLLRATITGAPETPYHDGLFFFDIVFPSYYPNNPLIINHLSFWLSLINTWNRTKVERWTPQNSTIFQLIVSIQGLILNSQPYFNKPGCEKHIKSEKFILASLNAYTSRHATVGHYQVIVSSLHICSVSKKLRKMFGELESAIKKLNNMNQVVEKSKDLAKKRIMKDASSKAIVVEENKAKSRLLQWINGFF